MYQLTTCKHYLARQESLSADYVKLDTIERGAADCGISGSAGGWIYRGPGRCRRKRRWPLAPSEFIYRSIESFRQIACRAPIHWLVEMAGDGIEPPTPFARFYDLPEIIVANFFQGWRQSFRLPVFAPM